MQINPNTKITFLGHSTFLIQTPGKKHILLDPWLKENPSCPEKFKTPQQLPKIDLLLLSHAHFDHMSDAVAVGTYYQPQTPAIYELATWLESKGLKNVHPMNKGGSLAIPSMDKIQVSLGHAIHSSSIQDGHHFMYAGEACSFVLQLEDGFKIYYAGDTMLFGDMKLIGELHQPDLAFLPIGDRFTMGPKEAAKACQMVQAKKVIPMHFGTFPPLTGTPQHFAKALQGSGIEMVELKPGETC